MNTQPLSQPEPRGVPVPELVLVLVRHGCTALNAAGRLRGHLDPPLDGVGLSEVARLAGRLAPVLAGGPRHQILSSPLRRTTQTAQAIADRAGLTVTIDNRLIDRDYGAWAGQPLDEVVRRWGSVDAAPGVESHASVVARVRDILGEPITDAPAVLVTHDAILHAILEDLDPELAAVALDPASWCLLGRSADGALTVISTNIQ